MGMFSKFRARKGLKKDLKGDNRLLYLESIRGIAALIVVFAHIKTAFFPYPIVNEGALSAGNAIVNALFYGLPFGWLIAGHFAVIVFFVLSGYVLTYRYYETFSLSELQKQGAKRYFRLAIPVFATVLLAYFMYATGMMSFSGELARITGDPGVAANFTFTPSFNSAFYDATVGVLVNKSAVYNPVLWTMPVELIGSFVVFGFAALVAKNKRRWLFYIAAIILLSQTYYVAFIIGMAMADAIHNTKALEYSKKILNKGYVLLGIAVVLVLASAEPSMSASGPLSLQGVDLQSTMRLWHCLAAALFLWLAICSPGLQKFLSFKPFVVLGSLSFAVYLLHYLVLFSLGAWVFVSLWHAGSGLGLSALVAGLAVIIVTFLAAIIWKRYVDDAAVKISRAFAHYALKS